MKIFIGYDRDEEIAYHVLSSSIIRYASSPPEIIPLKRDQLRTFTRERGPHDSTDFSNSRFMVPFLSCYKGFSLYMDCDMVVTSDIFELVRYINPTKAVMVVKHDYTPKSVIKFYDQKQTRYGKKNWSSLMLFNNQRCKALSPHYINAANGLDLHQFKWLAGDDLIGDLDLEWNWLVGEYPDNPDAKILHYTLGGPWQGCDDAVDTWIDARTWMEYSREPTTQQTTASNITTDKQPEQA